MVDTELLVNVRLNLAQAEQQMNQFKQTINTINQAQTISAIDIATPQQRFAQAISTSNNALKEQIKLGEQWTAEIEYQQKVLRMPSSGFGELQQQMKILNQVGTEVGRNSDLFARQKQIVDQVNESMGQFKLTEQQLKRMQIQTKKFSWSFLSLMFFGMILQRTFGNAFKSIFDNYKKIVGLNSEFTKSVMKLQANWSYLKFAIANAFNSPAIINAIEWFSDKIEWLGDYLADHPGFSRAILIIIGALAAAGTGLVIWSGFLQLGMVVDYFVKLWTTLRGGALATAIGNVKSKLLELGSWIKDNWQTLAISGINLAGLTLSTTDLIKNIKEKDWAGIIGDSVAAGLYTAGAITSFFSKAAGLTLFIAGTVVFGFTKIGEATRKKTDILEVLGFKENTSILTDWGASLITGMGELLGQKPLKEYTDSISLAMADVESKYKETNEQIKSINEDLTKNSIKYTLDELTKKEKLLSDYQTNLETLTTQGLTLDYNRMSEIIRYVAAENKAKETYTANQISNIESEKDKQDELNLLIEAYKTKLDDAAVVDLFQGIDLEQFERFKSDLENIKTPLAEFILLLNGDQGLYISLFKINTILTSEINIVTQLVAFNVAISEGNTILPTYTSYIDTQTTSMTNLARETNSAATAQERLNKAKGGTSKTTVNVLGIPIIKTYSSTTQ